MTEQVLSQDDLDRLRGRGLLAPEEVAVKAGDVVVAVNTLTGSRRPLDLQDLILESSRRVLRG